MNSSFSRNWNHIFETGHITICRHVTQGFKRQLQGLIIIFCIRLNKLLFITKEPIEENFRINYFKLLLTRFRISYNFTILIKFRHTHLSGKIKSLSLTIIRLRISHLTVNLYQGL